MADAALQEGVETDPTPQFGPDLFGFFHKHQTPVPVLSYLISCIIGSWVATETACFCSCGVWF